MDKKSNMTAKITQYNFNKNYITSFNKNENQINDLYTEFQTSEYLTLIERINSNELLNFRNNKGETLIHAVISNSSSTLNEYQKLEIIKKLILKNVSVNAMNDLNQNALHLSAINGYLIICNYLIEIKTNETLIDNMGNAPVHYIISKIIYDCKENDFYKDSNKEIIRDKSINSDHINNTLNLIVTNKICESFGDKTNNEYLPLINNLISNYKYFKGDQINQIFSNQQIEIIKLQQKFNLEKDHDIKSLINSATKTITTEIYDDIDTINNNVDSNNLNNITETLNNNNNIKLNTNIQNIKQNFNNVIDKANKIEVIIDKMHEDYYMSIIMMPYTLFYIIYILKCSSDNKFNRKILDILKQPIIITNDSVSQNVPKTHALDDSPIKNIKKYVDDVNDDKINKIIIRMKKLFDEFYDDGDHSDFNYYNEDINDILNSYQTINNDDTFYVKEIKIKDKTKEKTIDATFGFIVENNKKCLKDDIMLAATKQINEYDDLITKAELKINTLEIEIDKIKLLLYDYNNFVKRNDYIKKIDLLYDKIIKYDTLKLTEILKSTDEYNNLINISELEIDELELKINEFKLEIDKLKIEIYQLKLQIDNSRLIDPNDLKIYYNLIKQKNLIYYEIAKYNKLIDKKKSTIDEDNQKDINNIFCVKIYTKEIFETESDKYSDDIYNFYYNFKVTNDNKRSNGEIINNEISNDGINNNYVIQQMQFLFNDGDGGSEYDYKYFKYKNINNLITCIKRTNELVIQNFNMFIEKINMNNNYISEFSIKFNLFYSSQIIRAITMNINNFIMLEKLINEIDMLLINKTKITEQIYSDHSPNQNKDMFEYMLEQSEDDIQKYFANFIIQCNELKNKFISNHKQELYKNNLKEMFDLYHEIIIIIYKIIDETNKYQSSRYLQCYNNNDININNIYVNKFKWREQIFDKSYDNYKNKYYILNNNIINIYEINYNSLPYYQYHDFNIVHTKLLKNNIKYYGLIFSKKKIEVESKLFNLKYIKNDKYNKGYMFTDTLNLTDDFINNTEVLNNVKFKNNFDIILDNDYYKNQINTVSDDKNVQVKFINNEDEYDNTIITEYTKDKILPIIICQNINDFINIIIDKICTEIFTSPNYNLLFEKSNFNDYKSFTKKENEMFDQTLKYIKTNEDVKKDFVQKCIINIINKYVQSRIIIETNIIIKKFIKELKITNYYTNNRIVKLEDYNKQLSKNFTNNTNISDILKIINNDHINFKTKSNIKLLNNKCMSEDNMNKLLDIKFDWRLKDINGNTILCRLIDQYNLYGVEKIANSITILKSTLNSQEQTPVDYLLALLKNVQSNYLDNNFNLRIKIAEEILVNELSSQTQFSEYGLDMSNNLVQNLIKNCIYLFNEYLWIRMLEYPNGWTIIEKNKLENIVLEFVNINKTKEITSITEQLLISTFDSFSILNTISSDSNNKLVKELEIKIINTKINIDQLNNAKTLIDPSKKIKELSMLLVKYEDELIKLNTHTTTINKDANIIKNKIIKTNFIPHNSIDFDAYNELIQNTIQNSYFKVLVEINKLDPDKLYISSFQLELFKIDYSKISDNNDKIKLLESYHCKIIDDVCDDYYDLDKFANSEYNVTHWAILSIIKINVINIFAFELHSTLIQNIESNIDNYNELIKNYLVNDYTSIFKSIIEILIISTESKLKIQNFDSDKNLSDYKSRLTYSLIKIFNIQDELFRSELETIIDYFLFICDNVSLIVYDELINIIDTLKKMSILIKMISILK